MMCTTADRYNDDIVNGCIVMPWEPGLPNQHPLSARAGSHCWRRFVICSVCANVLEHYSRAPVGTKYLKSAHIMWSLPGLVP